jgi:hypothetical protein
VASLEEGVVFDSIPFIFLQITGEYALISNCTQGNSLHLGPGSVSILNEDAGEIWANCDDKNMKHHDMFHPKVKHFSM